MGRDNRNNVGKEHIGDNNMTSMITKPNGKEKSYSDLRFEMMCEIGIYNYWREYFTDDFFGMLMLKERK